MAGVHRLDVEETNRLSPHSSPPESTSSTTAIATCETSQSGLVHSLLNIARSRTSVPYKPVSTQPEYLPLNYDDSEDDDQYFTIDRNRTCVPTEEHECPDHIDEMLQIVRELRSLRMDSLSQHAQPLVTPEPHESRAKSTNTNNLLKTNLSDFMDL